MRTIDAFRSLRHRPFRRFFVGQTISIIGFWTQQIALTWTVYRLTGSPALLGVVAFAANIPMLVVSPFAGVLVDRFDRRHVVLATQGVQMLQAVTLAVLAVTGWLRVEHIIVLSALYGLTWSFDTPARQSLLTVMVGGRDDLPNAIALNSAIMNLGRFVGPAVAGTLLAAVGEAGCFAINALSYLAVLPALWALPPSRSGAPPAGLLRDLAEGFRWVWQTRPARLLIGTLMITSFTLPSYMSMMPVFASDVFGGDAKLQGLLVSSAGAGALVGTAMLAMRASVHGLVTTVIAAGLVGALALTAFSLAGTLWLAMPALAVVGFAVIVTAAGTNTILQSIVEERLRARIVSIYVMAFLGMSPLGSLAVGALSRATGVQLALAGYGIVCLIVAGLMATRHRALRDELARLHHRPGA